MDFLSVYTPIGLLGTSPSDAAVVVAQRIQEQAVEHDSSVIPRLVVPHSTGSSFRGNDMEADLNTSSSASSPFSMKKDVIQVDGIDIATEHRKRSDLLAKLAGLVSENRFVRLTSPAASGKTSLLKMFQHSLKKSKTKVIWISCLKWQDSGKSCIELFALRELI
jgi:hypothetical protein